MYEQPEWREGRVYYAVVTTLNFMMRPEEFTVKIIYDVEQFYYFKNFFLVFATRELAQHAADKKNAELKLLRLAQGREKEFNLYWRKNILIDYQGKYYFCFFLNHITKKAEFEVIYTSFSEYNAIFFSFDNEEEAEKWLESNFTQAEIEALCRPVRYV